MLRSTADFARHVGLARTTVSRVLNGQPGLKQKTIDRVQRALAETGFTPNAHALHLKGKRTAMVGICMEDLLTPPAVRKLATLQQLLRKRGFSSLIEVFTPGTGRDVVRHFLSMRVEAVVFIGHFHREEIEARIVELIAHGTPHLVIDHYGLKNANTVSLDRSAAMVALMNHLLDLGHRSFGLLGIARAPTSRYDRLTGIHAALKARGLDFDEATLSLTCTSGATTSTTGASSRGILPPWCRGPRRCWRSTTRSRSGACAGCWMRASGSRATSPSPASTIRTSAR
jgi:DNA-binding LacI/PurR family transcriptional regulator